MAEMRLEIVFALRVHLALLRRAHHDHAGATAALAEARGLAERLGEGGNVELAALIGAVNAGAGAEALETALVEWLKGRELAAIGYGRLDTPGMRG